MTGDRDSKLVQQGWATQQQGGTDRLTLEARDAAVAVATANITAQNAQLRVLTQQKNYQSVVAAFDGVMTQRNVDIGALVQADAANGTFLFILMQSDTIRIQLYVPQDEAFGVAPGTAAVVRVPEMPGSRLSGNGDAHCRRVAAGYANALDQAESDFILGFGASFTQWTTKKGKLIAPGAVVAQVDIEAPKLGYQMPIQHAVHGDARATAEALLAELDGRGMTSPKDGRRSDTMRERIRAGDNHHFSHLDESSAQFIDPRTLSKAVDAILPADRVVASDSGHFCGWVPRYLRVPNARASCLSHSFRSVGLGLASTVGLAIANPGKLAVLGAGDGGFLMSISDLETAIRLGLRMCILIYNDSSYAAEVHYFRHQGFSIDIVQFPETDFAAIARGYGARGATVRTPSPTSSRYGRGSRRARRGFSSLTAKSIQISKPTGTPSIFHREPGSIPTCRFRTIRAMRPEAGTVRAHPCR